MPSDGLHHRGAGQPLCPLRWPWRCLGRIARQESHLGSRLRVLGQGSSAERRPSARIPRFRRSEPNHHLGRPEPTQAGDHFASCPTLHQAPYWLALLPRETWHGPPEFIRSDNGAEFIAGRVRDWIAAAGAKTAFIEPGSPWENGYCESFNSRFRDELLNGEVFYTLREAQILIALPPENWTA